MHGPMAARIDAGREPSRTMACTVACTTPLNAPCQPEWQAPTTRAMGSANSTGAQSAASTPSATPGARVTMASAFGRFPAAQGLVTNTTSSPCTWCTVHSMDSGMPSSSMASRRFSATCWGASSEPGPQLSEA